MKIFIKIVKSFPILDGYVEVNARGQSNCRFIDPLSANPTKWPNTLKQLVGKLFDHFMGLARNGLKV